MTDLARARVIFDRQGDARWRLAASLARDRVARLRRLKRAVVSARQDLRAALRADLGRAAAEADLTEIDTVVDEINFVARFLTGWMRPEPVAGHPLLRGRAEIRHHARGRVLVLAPWNYPVYLSLMPLVSAMAAGNTVILKPSERAPRTAAALARLVGEAALPEEAAVVTGGVDVAAALLDLPFDHIFFTGSQAVGRIVAGAAARHAASVTLELGGKSPVIVDATADLARAARRIMWAKLVNAGQTCVSPDYVLVGRDRAPALAAALVAAAEGLYGPAGGWPGHADFARIVDDRAFDRLQAMLDDAVSRGARVECGGDTDRGARYVAPTVLTNVDPGARLMREEIFGPILPVVPFDREDEAVATARGHGTPLALYVFGSDERADWWLGAVPSGGAAVNHALVHLANSRLPFGGQGASGTGRYHGRHGFLELSHERGVVRYGRWAVPDALTPPYDRWWSRVARGVIRVFG